jgi:hypothetical protein
LGRGAGTGAVGDWCLDPRALALRAALTSAASLCRRRAADRSKSQLRLLDALRGRLCTVHFGACYNLRWHLRLTIFRGHVHGHMDMEMDMHHGHGHGHGARGAATCQQRRHSPSFTTHRRKTQPRTEGGEATGTAETDTTKMSALSPGARHTPSSPEPDSDLASFTGKAFKF